MRTMYELRDKLKGEIVARMRKISDELSSGRAADYPEYKRGVGRIQGLKDGLDAVDDVFRKFDDEGDSL